MPEVEKEPSFKDDLSADLDRAFSEVEKSEPVEIVEAPVATPETTEKSERVRAPDGKFAKADAPVEITDELKADESWPAEVKAAWEKTPPEGRKFLRNSFDEMQNERKGFAPDKELAKSIKDVSAPYMAMIQSEGSDLPKAIGSLLQTAYTLRHAPADQKKAALLGLAQKFNIDLGTSAPTQESDLSQLSPELAAFQRQLKALESTVTTQIMPTLTQAQEAQQRAAFHQIFTEFENDKTNYPHFVDVYEQMTMLVGSIKQRNPGLDDRSVLKQAYNNAIWLNESTRSKMQVPGNPPKEPGEKTAVAAKAAVRGAPQGAAPTKPQVKVHDDPRDDLLHLWNQAEQGAA